MKKEIIQIIIKVLIYALGLLGAYFGVTSLTSCSVDRSVETQGRGTGVFIYTDTFTVDHGSSTTIKVK